MDNYLLLPRAAASAVYYGCMAVLVGALLARVWLRGTTALAGKGALRPVMVVSSVGLVVLIPVQLWLMTAAMLVSTHIAAVDATLPEVITGTHVGKVMCAALVLEGVLAGLVGLQARRWRERASFVVLALLVAARAATGHASSDGDWTLREAVQWVHLASIAVWAGSVVVAGALVVPRLRDEESLAAMGEFGRRLSTTVTVAVVLVVLSGCYNAWQGLGGPAGVQWRALVSSQWGWLLTAKSWLVGVALALGAGNRGLVRRGRVMTAVEGRRFVLWMRCEAAVMGMVFLVTGLLANSPPAVGQ